MNYKPKTVRGTCPCNVVFTQQSLQFMFPKHFI